MKEHWKIDLYMYKEAAKGPTFNTLEFLTNLDCISYLSYTGFVGFAGEIHHNH